MTHHALLAGLDEVPWAALEHAYGPATDVPAQLRAVADRTGSVHVFFGNLWHQGTVYPATAPAVPFLVELAERGDPDVAAALLRLLASVARGVGYFQVHGGLSFGPPPDEVEAHVRAEFVHVGAAHAAVGAELERAAPFLTDPDPDVRAAAAGLLGAVAGVGARAVPFLVAALPREAHPDVRVAILDALGELALSDAARNAWRLVPAEWPAPVADRERAAALAVLADAAHRSPSPQERVVAADLLGALGAPVDRAPDALAADVVAAEADLGDRAVFWWSTELRLHVLAARCRAAALPLAVWNDLNDVCAARSTRPRGVALLVDLLDHASLEVRRDAAGRLRHVGEAARPYVPQLLAARADPLTAALLLRPLRLLGVPEADETLDAVIRGEDDRALLNVLDLVCPGDPPAWIPLLERRAARLERLPAELRGDGDDWLYGKRSRSGAQYVSFTAENVINRIRHALGRLRGEPPAPPPPLREADPAAARAGWDRVRALEAAWQARGDVSEVGEWLVGELVPRPSGVAALALLQAIGPARIPAARPVIEARLAEVAPIEHGSVEEDEAWLAALRRALDSSG